MKKLTIILFLCIIPFMFVRIGSSETNLLVDTAVIATGIKNLTPVGVAEKFSADVGKLYCFSKIIGKADGHSIKHVWYYRDKKVLEVPLAVKYPIFRTYSSKRIPPNYTGIWKVEIVAEDGTILETLEFNIN